MSHTAAEKNRHAAWNEIRPAIPAPASIPTTDRRPDRATIPVANTVNTTNVARRRNTGRKASSSPAHDPGKIIHRKVLDAEDGEDVVVVVEIASGVSGVGASDKADGVDRQVPEAGEGSWCCSP
jgi:hypothetical protein